MSLASGLVLVTSRNLVRGDNSSFRADLSNAVNISKARRWTAKELSIPHVFTNINIYNNKITLKETSGTPFASGATVTATVPVGQYTTATLVTAVNTAIAAATGVGGITIAIADVAGVAYTTLTTTRGNTLVVNEDNGVEGITELGFDVLGLAVGATTSTSVVGTHPVNVGGPRFVYVCSHQLAPANLVRDKGRTEDVIDQVSLHNVPFGGHVVKGAQDLLVNDFHFRDSMHFSDIDLFITDAKHRPLPLYGNYHVDLILKVFHHDGIIG